MRTNIKQFVMNNSSLLLAILVPTVLISLTLCIFPCVFETNDDKFMEDIVSGFFTGTPNAYAIHTNYIICIVLSFLYLILPQISWYGFFFLFVYLLGDICILYFMINNQKRYWNKVVIISVFAAMFFVLQLPELVSLQFTRAAAFSGTAAVCIFLLLFCTNSSQNNKKGFWVIGILSFLSFGIRSSAFLMLLPIAGLFFLYVLFGNRKDRVKVSKMFILFGTIFLAVGIPYLVNMAAYGTNEWKEYIHFNTQRSDIMDYSGYPSYEGNEEMYQKYGIGYDEYITLSQRYGIELLNIDADTLKEIRKTAQSGNEPKSFEDKIVQTIKNMTVKRMSKDDAPYSTVVLVLYIAVLILSIIKKEKQSAILTGLLFLGTSISWFYLFYRGRFPVRVSQSLYVMEAAVLLSILVCFHLFERIKWKWAAIFTNIAGVGIAMWFIYLGYQRANVIYPQMISAQNYASGTQTLNQYCYEHNQNVYIVDTNSILWFSEPALYNSDPPYANYLLTGTWMAKSPLMEEKKANMGIEDVTDAIVNKDNVYVIFNADEYFDKSYLWNLLDRKYDYSYKIIDTIEGEYNIAFDVYKVSLNMQNE